MSHRSGYIENLPRLAADAYEVSGRLCGSCSDLHALWPYIRLARASTGVEVQPSVLETQLTDLFARGLRSILIAGAADTGLLALVARAGAHHGAAIVVLDICETPLDLCRRFAKQWSLPIETIMQDLRDLDIERRFDVVLVHGTLHFISADRRAEALVRMRRSLRPGGRLLLLFNTSRPIGGELVRESRTSYASWVLDELHRLNVPLPDDPAIIHARLNAHSKRRELREGAFAEPGEVAALLKSAGFIVNDCTRVDVELVRSVESFISKIAKRRFIMIAEPTSTP